MNLPLTRPKTTHTTTTSQITTPQTGTTNARRAASTSSVRQRRAARQLAVQRATATRAAQTTATRNSCARSQANPPSEAVLRLARPIDMTPTPYKEWIRESVASHGLSRDGAIAAVIAAEPTRRVMSFAARVALFVFGTVTIGCSVGVMLWNNVGPGPLDVFIGGIRRVTGLPLMFAFLATIAGVLTIATVLGRRPGPGSFAGPLIIAPVVQTAASVLNHVEAPHSLPLQVVIQLAAIAAVGVGAGSMIVSRLGAGSGELLARAASERIGRPESRVRMIFEVTWLAVGFVLGGPIGWGTVVVAIAIGPAVATGTRVMTGVLTQARRTARTAASVAFVAS